MEKELRFSLVDMWNKENKVQAYISGVSSMVVIYVIESYTVSEGI